MQKKDVRKDDWYREFAEDLTYQARASRGDNDIPAHIRESVKQIRNKWRARDYQGVVEAAETVSEDSDAYPYCQSYKSLALTALGFPPEESIVCVLRALRRLKKNLEKKERRKVVLSQMAKLYNQLAVRLYMVNEDDRAAELIARHAWDLSPDGRNGGFVSILTVCELRLIRARASGSEKEMVETLAEVDELMGELLDKFPNFEQDQEFVNYVHRFAGFQEYRESSYWPRRFGHTKAR